MASNFEELQNTMAAAATELDRLKNQLHEADETVISATAQRDAQFGDYQTAILTVVDNKVLEGEYLKALGHQVPRRGAKAEPVDEVRVPLGDDLVTYVTESVSALDQLKNAVAREDEAVEAITAQRDAIFGEYQDLIVQVLDEAKIYTPEVLESLGHKKARRPKRK